MKSGALMKSRRAVLLGLIAVLAAWTWQFLTVHYNYGGNWTALFRIRPGMPVPDFLKSENLYIFYNSEGYDGQVYHLVAHDPWMSKGSAEAITGASFRYQRIFVPALAWMLALGRDRWIHPAYFAVILAFVFLGVYWMSRCAVRIRRAPAWGLVFLLAPATIVSLDRMTVDIALAALVAGFALYTMESSGDQLSWKVIAILTCAVLTRETALPIVAGYALYLATRRRFVQALLIAATVLPAAAWYLYLARHLANQGPSALPDYIGWVPLAGFADRILRPTTYSISAFKNVAAVTLDYAALAGIAIALLFAAQLAIRKKWDPRACAAYALAIAAMFIGSRSVWEDVDAFGRVLTPLLLLAAVEEWDARPWIALSPLLLVDARIGLDLAAQIYGVGTGMIRALLK
jgi:hypothetical protein